MRNMNWNWLFTRWGMLDQAEAWGAFVHVVASLLAIAGMVAAGRELLKERSTDSGFAPRPRGVTSPDRIR